MAKSITKLLQSWIGSMATSEGSPMLRIRPAFRARRKSAPPRAAKLAAMPVPIAAPTRKSPRCPGRMRARSAFFPARFLETLVMSGDR
jgi:hypothetical protein